MDGHDADQIVFGGEHDGRESIPIRNRLLHAVENTLLLLTQGVTIDPVIRDDGELRGVDRIGPLAQDLALGTLLAAAYQKSSRILKIGFFRGLVGREHLRALNGAPSRANT